MRFHDIKTKVLKFIFREKRENFVFLEYLNLASYKAAMLAFFNRRR